MIDALVFLLLLTIILGLYLDQIQPIRPVSYIAAIGFALRVAFVLVDDVLRVFAGSGDAPAYERTLWFVADLWHSGVVDAPLYVTSGPGNAGYYEILYSVMLAPVYFFFGRSPLLIRLSMALIGALIVVNIYLIGRELFDERAGLWACAITAVFPYWIYLNGILYRDTLVILLFTWMGYYLLRWQSEADRRAIVFCLIATGLGLSLRLENIPAVAALFAVAIYTKFEPGIRQKVHAGAVFLGLTAVFIHRFGSNVTVGGLASRRLRLSRESTASYLTDWAYESLPELVAFVPIGMLYFTLVPFPWQPVNPLAVISILQNLFVWYPIVVLAILGIRDALTGPAGGRLTIPLIAFTLAGLFTYGLVEGNIGPAMRHRSQFQFAFFAFAGVALARRVELGAIGSAPESESKTSESTAA